GVGRGQCGCGRGGGWVERVGAGGLGGRGGRGRAFPRGCGVLNPPWGGCAVGCVAVMCLAVVEGSLRTVTTSRLPRVVVFWGGRGVVAARPRRHRRGLARARGARRARARVSCPRIARRPGRRRLVRVGRRTRGSTRRPRHVMRVSRRRFAITSRTPMVRTRSS